MKKIRHWLPVCLAAVLWAPIVTSLSAVSTTVVISEFRVRGPNGGSDEFVEIHNRSASVVSIGGWKLRGSNASGTVGDRATIPAGTTLAPGCFYLFTNSSTSGGPYSGATAGNQTYGTGITDDGGLALTLADNTVVDAVGMSNGSAFKEGTPLASLGSSNLNRSYERLPGGTNGHADTDNNAADFAVITPSNPQNSSSRCIVYGQLAVAGSATPNPVVQFADTLVTGVVTRATGPLSSGLSVTADLTALGGNAAQTLFDDGSNGDATPNDLVYSYRVNVTTAAGARSVTLQANDAEGRTASSSFTVTVQPPPVIYLPHDIQGAGTTSPFLLQTVTVEGVVTGRRSNGLFIQTEPGRDDGDPATSEGLFVFTGGGPPAAAAVGTLVRVTGEVAEYNGDGNGLTLTQLAMNPTFLVLGNTALPAPVALTTAMLSPDGSLDQLEPLEGMLVHAASLTSVSGTAGAFFSATGGEAAGISTSTGVFYAVLTGTPRPVREPGLDRQIAARFAGQCAAGAPCNIAVFDGNPERLRVDSDALGAPPMDLTSGVVVENLVGIIDSGFFTWGLLPVPEAPGIAGANMVGSGVAAPSRTQFTVGSFNMQRFFDTVNDPGVSDVVLTPANFAARLSKASLAIRQGLRMPDILAVQEVENLSVLQAVADRVNTDAGLPGEYTAYLEEGNDVGGIDVGFLVRSRVQVASVTQVGKTEPLMNPATGLPYTNTDGSPQLLNDRPPLVLRARVTAPLDRLDADVIVVTNHLRSLNGVADANPRVRHKRQQQAEFLAALLDALQDEAAVISVGDYNAFEFSDGLVDVMGTVVGNPSTPDRVVAASFDLVEPDFLFTAPGVYSYIFDGNAQTLDHAVLSAGAAAMFDRLEHGRINADFPEIYRNDASRMERVSDHDPAVGFFNLPMDTVPPTVAVTPSLSTLWPANHQLVGIELAIAATDNRAVAACGVTGVTSNEAPQAKGAGATPIDWVIDGPTSVRLRAERAGGGTGRIYTIAVACDDAAGNRTTATTNVAVPHDRGRK